MTYEELELVWACSTEIDLTEETAQNLLTIRRLNGDELAVISICRKKAPYWETDNRVNMNLFTKSNVVESDCYVLTMTNWGAIANINILHLGESSKRGEDMQVGMKYVDRLCFLLPCSCSRIYHRWASTAKGLRWD